MDILSLCMNTKTDGLDSLIKCLQTGVDVNNYKNNDNCTALMFAAAFSSTEDTVKLLIDAGADLDCKDKNGLTALTWAVINTNGTSTENTVKLLVDAGADVNAKDKHGWTVLMNAIDYLNSRCIDSGKITNVKLVLSCDSNDRIRITDPTFKWYTFKN